MMKNSVFSLVAVLLFICSGCQTEKFKLGLPISQAEMWDCYHENSWEESQLADRLTGKWQWMYKASYGEVEQVESTKEENVTIEFLDNATLQVAVDGEIQETTSWSLIVEDGELYGLELGKPVDQLFGRILLCDDILEFNNSYLDGEDNYFERVVRQQ